MTVDRRSLFFLGAALTSAVLVPVIDRELRWVPMWVAAIYLVLALLSFLDDRAGNDQRG